MFTTADDWLDRFETAGCKLRIGKSSRDMAPHWDSETSECFEFWAEIVGDENRDKWESVYDKVVERVIRRQGGLHPFDKDTYPL